MEKKSKKIIQFFVFLVFILLINSLISVSIFSAETSGSSSGTSSANGADGTIYKGTDGKLTKEKIDPKTGKPNPEATSSDIQADKAGAERFLKEGEFKIGSENSQKAAALKTVTGKEYDGELKGIKATPNEVNTKNFNINPTQQNGKITVNSDGSLKYQGTTLKSEGVTKIDATSKGVKTDKFDINFNGQSTNMKFKSDGAIEYKGSTIKSNGQTKIDLTSDGFKVGNTDFSLKGQGTKIEVSPDGKDFKINGKSFITEGQNTKIEINSDGIKINDKTTMQFSEIKDTVHITDEQLEVKTSEGQMNVDQGLAEYVCPCSGCSSCGEGSGEEDTQSEGDEQDSGNKFFKPGSGLGGAGQGLGGGLQGGTFEQQLIGAVQAVMGLLGNLKGIVDSIAQKQQAGEDQKGQLQRNTELAQLTESGTGEGTPTADYKATGDGVKVTQTSSDVYLKSDNGNELILNARPGQVAESIFNTNLDSISTKSTDVIVAPGVDGAKPVALVRSGEEGVNIDSKAIAGGEPSVYSESTGISNLVEILPLVDAQEDSVTGDVVSSGGRQSVKFVQHDIEIDGRNLLVFPFKAYNELSAKGSKLVYLDGFVNLEFESAKTYYPREIKHSSHFVNKISNEYDTNNYFRLIPNGKDNNYFVDGKKTITVGDDTAVNPLEGYDNIPVSKTRQIMWKKAAKRV